MDIKNIFLWIAIAYVVYYVVQIGRDFMNTKKPKRSTKEANVINLQSQKVVEEDNEDVESAPAVEKEKRSLFSKKQSQMSPKAQNALQIENIIGIHLVEDNELIGPDSDLNQDSVSIPVDEYLNSLRS